MSDENPQQHDAQDDAEQTLDRDTGARRGEAVAGGDDTAKPTLVGRVLGLPAATYRWSMASARNLMIAGGVLVLLNAVLMACWVFSSSGGSSRVDELLAKAETMLDEHLFEKAREHALDAKRIGRLHPGQESRIDYILGVDAVYQAENEWGETRRSVDLMAAHYLKDSYDVGFPTGREAEGTYLLGKTLFQLGRYPSARRFLTEAIQLAPNHATEIHRMLGTAYLHDQPPQPKMALDENTQYIESPDLSPAEYDQAILQRSEILLRLAEYTKTLTALDMLPSTSRFQGDANVLRGRVYLAQAEKLRNEAAKAPTQEQETRTAESDALYDRAIEIFRRVQGHDAAAMTANYQAMYLIGLCLIGKGENAGAIEQLQRTATMSVGTPEAVAAIVAQIDLMLSLERYEDAMELVRQLFQVLPPLSQYDNFWIPLPELEKRLIRDFRRLVDAKQFEDALELTALCKDVFPPDRPVQMEVDARKAWIAHLRSEARTAVFERRAELENEMRTQYRQIGTLMRRLSAMRTLADSYVDNVWESANSFFLGHDYPSAIHMFNLYLKVEAKDRHPLAMAQLGESLLAIGRTELGLRTLTNCIDFYPRDAATYKARLLAAKAYVQKSEFEKAENLLLDNLNGDRLTPDSVEWRNSLFDLGLMLHLQRRFHEAIPRLEEAMQRYPDAPQVTEGRYALADSYYEEALQIQQRLRESLGGTGRRINTQRTRQLFEQALEQFSIIRAELTRKLEKGELSPLENAILRNVYFAIGNVEFAQNRYQEAIRAYANATNRYQTKPEVLLAYTRMSDAYRRLGELRDAMLVLERAKVVLQRMPENTDFSVTTNFDRQQWGDMLDLLILEIQSDAAFAQQ